MTLTSPCEFRGCEGSPHFIDINPGGTGPPHKATSIEWGVHRCFLKPFSLKNGGDPVQKGQAAKLKIHLYKVPGCMFYICDPKTRKKHEKTYFHDLGHGGAHTAFFRGCFGDLFEGTRTPMFDGFSRFWWAWSDSKLINTWMKLNWIDFNWFDIKSWHCTTISNILKYFRTFQRKIPWLNHFSKIAWLA